MVKMVESHLANLYPGFLSCVITQVLVEIEKALLVPDIAVNDCFQAWYIAPQDFLLSP